MNARNKPAAEIEIDETLVRCLLDEQHPDLAHLDIVEVAAGWDNAIFRLGEQLCLRMPRRQFGADVIEAEQVWLPRLADHLPVPVPAAIRIGRHGCGFPWPWSVVPWFDGHPLGTTTPDDQDAFARDLGDFLAALHVPAPDDAPVSSVRGVPLVRRDASFRECLSRVGSALPHVCSPGELERLWEAALQVDDWHGVPLWVHGDIHPLNLLVDDRGALVAVIDFGDLNGGDPATDLAIAWTAIDDDARSAFRERCALDGSPVDDASWARGWGWALNFAVVYLANSADVPVLHDVGRRALERLVSDPQV